MPLDIRRNNFLIYFLTDQPYEIMKNALQAILPIKTVFTYLFILLLLNFSSNGFAQCTPPMAEECEFSSVLCSLDELNGYACNNPSTVASPCNPLCSQGGVGHNTSWWGFVTNGGTVSITMEIGGCTTQQGLQFGIWGDCVCREEIVCRSIPCIPPNSNATVNVNLIACKTYYLWVDGCSGDICDFTLHTSGGGPPQLSPLTPINNLQTRVIQPVCEGACNFLFFVNPQPGGCEPTYVWTLDGDEVGDNSNEQRLDFPDQGDFVICVTAYIGNPTSGSICAQEGPVCATIKVRPNPDKEGVPRTICYEQANPGGYKWFSQRIFQTGYYREQFTDANCCKFDSLVHFTILARPTPQKINYIGCNGEAYKSPLGITIPGCRTNYEFNAGKTQDRYRCDSSAFLTAIYPTITTRFTQSCNEGIIIISSNLSIKDSCNSNASFSYSYFWYRHSDPTKTILSTDERIFITKPESYCLEVSLTTLFEGQSKSCISTFCYDVQVDTSHPNLVIAAADTVCVNEQNHIVFDTSLVPGIQHFFWELSPDGTIVSAIPELSNSIDASWTKKGQKKVCLSFKNDSLNICFLCKEITVIKAAEAGADFKVFGLKTSLNANPVSTGLWRKISGPGSVAFSNPRDPKSRVTVSKTGIYQLEWDATNYGCHDLDTVQIEFFTYPKILVKKTPLVSEKQNQRNQQITNQGRIVNFQTPNPIESVGRTSIEFDESILFERIQYCWINLTGSIELNGTVYNTNCNSICEIKAPVKSGLYLLQIDADGFRGVQKVLIY